MRKIILGFALGMLLTIFFFHFLTVRMNNELVRWKTSTEAWKDLALKNGEHIKECIGFVEIWKAEYFLLEARTQVRSALD